MVQRQIIGYSLVHHFMLSLDFSANYYNLRFMNQRPVNREQK